MLSIFSRATAAIKAAGLTEPVKGEHVWFDSRSKANDREVVSCAWCGIGCCHDDGANAPCPGRVRITPRVTV